ncbi:hypothetical protein Tco_1077999 [Tanacetum coccineum]
MDFITKLPKTKSRHDTIWVTVDRLTNSANFMATREDYSTERLARDAIGYEYILSSSTDGQSERTIHLPSPVLWAEIGESSLIGPELVQETTNKILLRLPKELSEVHDTFHVSNFKKCLADANLHVPLDEIKIDKTLYFVEEPVEIMDREVKTLKRSKISIVKVR